MDGYLVGERDNRSKGQMDTYFQTQHNLPSELVRIIFSFSSLSVDLVRARARLTPPEAPPSAINIAFFTTWEFLRDQVDDTGTLVVRDAYGRVRTIYQIM